MFRSRQDAHVSGNWLWNHREGNTRLRCRGKWWFGISQSMTGTNMINAILWKLSVCVCAQCCVCLIGAKKETGQIIARGLRGKHSVTGWRRTLYFLCMCVCTWLCVWTHSCILVLTMCMTVHSMFVKFLKNMDFIINLHKNNNWKCNLSIFSLLYLLLVYINKDAGVHCFPV